MCEIEFRAWDRRLGTMISNEKLVAAGRSVVSFAKKMRPDMKDMENAKGGLLLPTDDENLNFMQYIGSQDKNGKKIYRGDIIVNTNAKKYRVVWKNLGWAIENESSNYTGWVPERTEVIGNIYEHSHLLKEANTHVQDT